MGRALRTGATSDRFIETALELITEEGGSGHINLRQISRRMGCAHTNLYNYFPGYQDLLWAAFRRTLVFYGDWLTKDLDESLLPEEYVRRLLLNLATFPQVHPGLYRFIASDQMPTSDVPEDILDTVGHMKRWLSEAFKAASEPVIASAAAAEIADIVLAYVDGETLNLINERVVPGEDVPGRIVGNALRLFRLLVGDSTDPSSGEGEVPRRPYPDLHLPSAPKGA